MFDLIKFLGANYAEILMALSMIVGAAEIITRVTPTKEDDSFVERIGKGLRKVMDLLRIPNVKKK